LIGRFGSLGWTGPSPETLKKVLGPQPEFPSPDQGMEEP